MESNNKNENRDKIVVSNHLNETCNVLLLVNGCIVGGHISQESAVKLAREIFAPLLDNCPPVPITDDATKAIPEARPAKGNWTGSSKNDANIPITQKQLDCLSNNSDREQFEICEKFHVQSLEELTKEQASQAIKASMDAKEARKKNYKN